LCHRKNFLRRSSKGGGKRRRRRRRRMRIRRRRRRRRRTGMDMALSVPSFLVVYYAMRVLFVGHECLCCLSMFIVCEVMADCSFS